MLEYDSNHFLDERVKEYLIPNTFIFLPSTLARASDQAGDLLTMKIQPQKQRLHRHPINCVGYGFKPEAELPVAWAAGNGRGSVERVGSRHALCFMLWVGFGSRWSRVTRRDRRKACESLCSRYCIVMVCPKHFYSDESCCLFTLIQHVTIIPP